MGNHYRQRKFRGITMMGDTSRNRARLCLAGLVVEKFWQYPFVFTSLINNHIIAVITIIPPCLCSCDACGDACFPPILRQSVQTCLSAPREFSHTSAQYFVAIVPAGYNPLTWVVRQKRHSQRLMSRLTLHLTMLLKQRLAKQPQ